MLVLSRQRDEYCVATIKNHLPADVLQEWIRAGRMISPAELLQYLVEVEVRVTVLDIRGDKSRLGFAAPKHVAIHRSEVQQAIEREARRGPRPAEAATG